MADLTSDLAGIRSPNPFWLASAPPTNSGYQVMRAFAAGWGGAVWKTLALEPIVNVSARFGGLRPRRQTDGRDEQHRAHQRPAAGREPARDRAVQGRLSRPRDRGLADDRLHASPLARTGPRGADGAGRRLRAQLRLPARHVRARHGLGGRARPGARRAGDPLGERGRRGSGDRQAHAQHHRRALHRARGGAGRGRRDQPHQHHQQPDRGRHRHLAAQAARRRPGRARRLLRPGGQADRAQHGRRLRARSRRAASRSRASAGSATGATRSSSC